MFRESIRQLMFLGLVATIVGSVWVVAWSQELQAEATRGCYPAMPIPGLEDQTTLADQPPTNADDASSAQSAGPQNGSTAQNAAPAQSGSLKQVFLKDDQVVSVR
jgi:hypothetical protein